MLRLRIHLAMTLPIAIFALAIAGSLPVANAGTFLRVEFPVNMPDAAVHGINDYGKITGVYGGDTDEHGFVGPIDGPYQTFLHRSNGTEPRALNNAGVVVGVFSSHGGFCSWTTPMDKSSCGAFIRDYSGQTFTILKAGNVALFGNGEGINSNGQFVGDYRSDEASNTNLIRNGYLGQSGSGKSYVKDIALPNVARQAPITRVAPRGINSQGDVVGFYIMAGRAHGFRIKANGGSTSYFDIPDPKAIATAPQSINDKGEIAGNWEEPNPSDPSDSSRNLKHGFVLTADISSWTSFDAPGLAPGHTQAWQINNYGQIAVSAGNWSFIYCPAAGPNGCKGLARPRKEEPGREQKYSSSRP